MSRPKREPTDAELAIITKMRSGPYGPPLTEIRAALAEEVGNPPSIGLLHRWVTERREQEGREVAEEFAARARAERARVEKLKARRPS